jgi:hypothetical protein
MSHPHLHALGRVVDLVRDMRSYNFSNEITVIWQTSLWSPFPYSLLEL